MLSRLLIFIIFLIPCVGYGFSKPSVHQLSNGLTLVMVNDPNSTISSSYVFVRTGSIFEGPWLGSGVSHFLEHLLSGGTTEKKAELEYRTIIDQMGGAYNAYTTYDHTAYYIHSSTDDVPLALNTLYEWMFYAKWTNKEFEREQGVVIKEMERANSNMARQIYQHTQQSFYKDSPYRYPVIGYQSVFESITSDDLMTYYRTQYTPENMIVVVGGNVSENMVLEQISATFGSEPAKSVPIRYHGGEHTIISNAELEIEMPMLSSSRVVMRYPTVSFYHDDLYSLDLLAYILGNGQQSLLYQEFVINRQVATGISVHSITPANEFGYFEIIIETEEPKDEIVAEVHAFIEQFKWKDFSQDKIKRAKTQKRNEHILSQTSLDKYLNQIGRSMIMGMNPLFFSYYANNFEFVTNNELQGMIAIYLNQSLMQSYSFRNKINYSISTEKAEAQALFEVVNFKDGVDIILVPESNKDIVSVSVNFEGGLQKEMAEKNGIGHLSSKLLGKSTRFIKRKDYQAIFENKGARVSASFTHNSLGYSLVSTKSDAAQLLPYFLRGLTQFNITEEVFEEVRGQVIKGIEKKSEDWFSESFDQFKTALIASSSIMSHPLTGTIESVNGLTVSDIKQYINDRYNKDNIRIIIQANNPEQYLDMIKRELYGMSDRSPSLNKTVDLLSKKVESELSLTQPVGVVLAAKEIKEKTYGKSFIISQVIDALLSGMRYPSGLLHTRLRGEQLVYVVHATPMRLMDKDFLFIYALTDKGNVGNVAKIIQQSIEDLHQSIGKEQLKLAKSQVLFNMQQSFQNMGSKSKEIMSQLIQYNQVLPMDEFEEILSEISILDIHQAMDRIFNDPITMVEFNKE